MAETIRPGAAAAIEQLRGAGGTGNQGKPKPNGRSKNTAASGDGGYRQGAIDAISQVRERAARGEAPSSKNVFFTNVGGVTYDNDTLSASRDDFIGWMKSGSNKKYAYDFADPEDLERFENNRVSKAYEATYSDDPLDQWLKENGQASKGYFLKTYYPNAERTVAERRYTEGVYNDFRKKVFAKLQENPNTALKAISKEDISMAVSEVFLSDTTGQYDIVKKNFDGSFTKTIDDFKGDGTFSAEAKYKNYLVDEKYDKDKPFSAQGLMDDFTRTYYPVIDYLTAKEEREKQAEIDRQAGYDKALQGIKAKENQTKRARRTYSAQAPAPADNREARARLAKAGLSEAQIQNVLRRSAPYAAQGRAAQKDKPGNYLEQWQGAAELSEESAEEAYALLAEEGLSPGEIRDVFARNRFDYGKTKAHKERKEAEAKVDKELDGKLDAYLKEAGLKTIAREVGFTNQGNEKWQQETGIMRNAEHEDLLRQAVVVAWRGSMLQAGYEPLEVDNAINRANLSSLLPARQVAEDWVRWGLKDYNRPDEEIDAILTGFTEEDWAYYEKNLKFSNDVDASFSEQLDRTLESIPVRAGLAIAQSAVGLADMVVDWVDGKERDSWEVTQYLAEQSVKWRNYGTGDHHPILSGVSDVCSEILRIYGTAYMGGALGGLVGGVTGGAAGVGLQHFLVAAARSAPFVSGAIGSYYSEARVSGASARDATQYALVCGTTEGLLEKLSMGEAMGRAFSKRIAASLSGKGVNAFATKYGFTAASLLLSAAGEFTEESASEIVSTLMQQATWNPEAKLDWNQVWEAGGMGAVVGLVMSGLHAPATSRQYELALNIMADQNATARQKLLARGLLTADTRTFAEKLDSLAAAAYAETLPERQRQAMLKNGAAVLDHDAYVKAQAALQEDTAKLRLEQERYGQRLSKLDADEAKQQAKVDTLKRRLAAVDLDDPVRFKDVLAQLNAAEENLVQIRESVSAQKAAADKEHAGTVEGLQKAIADNTALLNRHYVARYARDFPEGPKSPEESRKAKAVEITLLENKWATGDMQAMNSGENGGIINAGGEEGGGQAGGAPQAGGIPEVEGSWHPNNPYASPWRQDGPGSGGKGDLLGQQVARDIGVEEQRAFQRVADTADAERIGELGTAHLLDKVVLSPEEYGSLRFYEALTGTSCSFYETQGEVTGYGFASSGYPFINLEKTRAAEDGLPLVFVAGHEWAHATPGVNKRLKEAIGELSPQEKKLFMDTWPDARDVESEVASNATGVIFYLLHTGQLPDIDPALSQRILDVVGDEIVKMAVEGVINPEVFRSSSQTVKASGDMQAMHSGENVSEPLQGASATDTIIKNELSSWPVYEINKVPGRHTDTFDIDAHERNTETARKEYGLAEAEDWRLKLYVSGSAYSLTKTQRDQQESEWSVNDRQGIESTSSALSKFPEFSGRTYRNLIFGLPGEAENAYDTFLSEHQKGSVVELKAFSSASKNPNGYVVEGEKVVHMVIDGFSGKDIADTYGIPSQQEVVHMPGTRLLITETGTANDGHPIIFAKELDKNDLGRSSGNGERRNANRGIQTNAQGTGNDVVTVSGDGRMPTNSQAKVHNPDAGNGAKSGGTAGGIKDLGANTPTVADMKESRLYSNTFRKILTEVEKAADGTEHNMYAVAHEKDTVATAKALVRGTMEREGSVESLAQMLGKAEAWGSTDIDTAMMILTAYRTEAAQAGDYAKVNEWKGTIREHATESAQALQAFAKWTRTTEGAMVKVDQVVAALNQENKRAIEKGRMKAIAVPESLQTELSNASTKEERLAALDKAAQSIAEQIPATLADKITAWRYLSMLGNPRTHLRNVLGNVFMGGLRQAKDVVGTAMEAATVQDRAQRTKAVLGSSEHDKALRGYARSTWEDASAAFEGDKFDGSKKGIERLIQDKRAIFQFKPLERARQLNSTALEWEDIALFARPAYVDAFAKAMKAKGLTGETITPKQRAEIMGLAADEALRATFRDESKIADLLNRIERSGNAGRLLVAGTVPFKKTPMNILKRGVEYSPIGLARGLANAFTKVKDGRMSAAQAIDQIAAGTVGTGLMAIGMFLAKAGVLRAGGEPEEDYEYYLRDLGEQPYSIKLGDTSFTVDWVTPASMPLFMGAELYAAGITSGAADASSLGNAFEGVLNALAQTTDPIMQLSMLQGIEDMLASIREEDLGGALGSVVGNAATNYAGQFFPTLGGQIARTIDPARRTTTGDPNAPWGKTADKSLRKIINKIPFAAGTNEPYINVWGEEEAGDGGWVMRLVENMLLPGYVDKASMREVDREVIRLYSETGDAEVIPKNYPYRTLKKNGREYTLTDSEYTQFKRDMGSSAYRALDDAIRNPRYQALADEEKAKFLKHAMEEAKERVLNAYKKEYLN